MRISIAIVAAIGLLAASAVEAIEDVACDDLRIHYEGPDDMLEVNCRSTGSGDAEASAFWESIHAIGRDGVLYVEHGQADYRSCIEDITIKDMFPKYRMFAEIEDWGDSEKHEGFKTRTFRGKVREGSSARQCVGFSRASAKTSRCGGFTHLLFGYYCADQAETLSGTRIGEILGGIRRDYE